MRAERDVRADVQGEVRADGHSDGRTGPDRSGSGAGWEVRTLGVEEEFLLVGEAGVPRPRSLEVLDDEVVLSDPDADPDRQGLAQELQQEQAEAGTRPRVELARLRADLVARRRALDGAARRHGVRVAATGTSPLAVRPHPTPDLRYLRMMDDYGPTAREQLTCGCHVHVGIRSRQEGIAVVNAIQPWLSVLLALSVNSPFWQGTDTGYGSYRRMVWDRWPVTGPTGRFADPEEYDATVAALERSGVLLDDGMVYFDARLSARYPTVEIRVADVCTDPDDAMLVAALSRGLVETLADADSPPPAARLELLRGAAWRAARSGLEGDLVDPVTGLAVPAADRVARLVDLVSPALRRAGDLDAVESAVHRLLEHGTGAARQRELFDRDGDLSAVVADVVLRTHGTDCTDGTDRTDGTD